MSTDIEYFTYPVFYSAGMVPLNKVPCTSPCMNLPLKLIPAWRISPPCLAVSHCVL